RAVTAYRAEPGPGAAPVVRRRGSLALLMLVPSTLFVVVFFVIPLGVMFAGSITDRTAGGLTIGHYVEILGDEYYWEIILRTVRVGAMSTALALLIGYPAALYLYFSQSRWRRVLLFIVVSPLFVSVIVRTYGWIVLLSPNGVLRAILPWDVRLLHTEAAIVLGLTHIYIPFMVLALNAALTKVDRRLISAAASLGASNLGIFRDVLFPLSIPGILAGCTVVFSISMTAFSIPVLLGGAARKTMPYLIYQQNLLLGNWDVGSALAFVLLAITLLIVVVLTRVTDRAKLRSALQ
ncbi:MAG: ABC transporter permease, partial [Rhodospirillales bacterium]